MKIGQGKQGGFKHVPDPGIPGGIHAAGTEHQGPGVARWGQGQGGHRLQPWVGTPMKQGQDFRVALQVTVTDRQACGGHLPQQVPGPGGLRHPVVGQPPETPR